MSLHATLSEFRSVLQKGRGYLNMAYEQDNEGAYLHDSDTQRFVTEAGFLRMFMGWEYFLENCFTKYMCGEPSILGMSVPRCVSPRDLKHAHQIVLGTMRYVDWSNPEIVRTLAQVYFDKGEPFSTCIGAIHSDLLDLRTIRNAAAHLSNAASRQLDGLGTRKLIKTCHNITVADLLLAIDPQSSAGMSILDSYIALLDVAAEGIARAK